MTRKPLISVRINPEDHEFIDEHLPPRRRSEFIQRAISNAVEHLKARRGVQMTRTVTGVVCAPRWATILDQFCERE